MFSKYLNPAITLVVVTAVFGSFSIAQQPQAPSQRFEPVRNVPPSVHVPQGQVKSLRTNQQQESGATNSGTSFNFSDTPSSAFRSAPAASAGNGHQPVARQVSYDQPAGAAKNQLPEIPVVLRGNRNPQTNSQLESFDATQKSIQALRPPAKADASQLDKQIVVDQGQFGTHQPEADHRQNGLRHLEGNSQGSQNQTGTGIGQVAYVQQEQTATHQIAQANSVADETSTSRSASSADRIASASSTTTGGLVNEIRQVSADSELMAGASISLATPAIRVHAFGPDSIGINKLGTYKITVSNDSNQDTEKIMIGIQIPESVDLQNINTTIGHHEVTDAVDQSRLIWTVDRVSAKTTHTIAVNAIPRTADPFDMQVEWSFAPRTGSTHVQVTQPQLEMKISGPTELLFGEKALYDVTVSNPGTGVAEQVSVALPEALGGERTVIGNVPAGGEKKFNVELLARTAGELNLATTAFAEGNIKATASHDILVRRANLKMSIAGPPMKYAGSVATYKVAISNDGDATASDVVAVIALPNGVKYVSGVSNAQASDSGLKWSIGTLTAGDKREFELNCQLDSSGELVFQAGARGTGDLAATSQCQTQVETIADLVLNVEDPKGPLPTGDNIMYKIRVKNRGTRSATGVNLVMQFSEGIEPVNADGFKNKIVTGQVVFEPIVQIDPGQEIVLNVTAQALQSGTHIFRAQLTCTDSDSREIAEGTTRFFGENVQVDAQQINLPSKANTADASEERKTDTNDFK